jgi:hypothetical protein
MHWRSARKPRPAMFKSHGDTGSLAAAVAANDAGRVDRAQLAPVAVSYRAADDPARWWAGALMIRGGHRRACGIGQPTVARRPPRRSARRARYGRDVRAVTFSPSSAARRRRRRHRAQPSRPPTRHPPEASGSTAATSAARSAPGGVGGRIGGVLASGGPRPCARQRNGPSDGGGVVEGRDIGTVVFTDATPGSSSPPGGRAGAGATARVRPFARPADLESVRDAVDRRDTLDNRPRP